MGRVRDDAITLKLFRLLSPFKMPPKRGRDPSPGPAPPPPKPKFVPLTRDRALAIPLARAAAFRPRIETEVTADDARRFCPGVAPEGRGRAFRSKRPDSKGTSGPTGGPVVLVAAAKLPQTVAAARRAMAAAAAAVAVDAKKQSDQPTAPTPTPTPSPPPRSPSPEAAGAGATGEAGGRAASLASPETGRRRARRAARAPSPPSPCAPPPPAPAGARSPAAPPPPTAPPAPPPPPASTSGEAWFPALAPVPLPALTPPSADAAAVRAAGSFIRARLCHGKGREAATLRLRPPSAALRSRLAGLLTRAAAMDGGPGASTSAVVLGPRGCGKSALVAAAVGDAVAAAPGRLGVVTLSGALHADERVAFREAARQLCAQFGCAFVRGASYEENLAFLRAVLAELRRGLKAVVFVLDGLDLFAARPRQALLYSLFDAINASDVQAAVVGCSSRYDALDLLEKRVRSRFSGRRFLLTPPGGGAMAGRAAAGDLEGRAGGGPAAASPRAGGGRDSPAAPAPPPPPPPVDAWPPPADSLAGVLLDNLLLPAPLSDGNNGSSSPPTPPHALDSGAVARWNDAACRAVAAVRSREALSAAATLGLNSASDAAALALAAADASFLSGAPPSAADLVCAVAALRAARAGGLSSAVAGLSVLELFVLAALARLERRGVARLTFDAAWAEYDALGRAGAGADAARGKGAAWGAFERLVEAGLVGLATGNAASASTFGATGEGGCGRARGLGGGAVGVSGGPTAGAAAVLAGAASLRPHARLELRPSPADVVAGAKAHTRAPPLLVNWLERDAGGVGRKASVF